MKNPALSLHAYTVFSTIAQRGSFADAAHQLNLSPSAVSHALAAFEEVLGFALFLRNRSGVRLTAAGHALLPTAREVLQCHEKLTQQASRLLGLETGTVRIGAFSSVSIVWMPNIIRSFAALYPKIDVVIEQGGYDDVVEWLQQSRVDLGFITLPAAPVLETTALYSDPLVCVTPADFVPQNRVYLTVEEVAGHNVILQGQGHAKETLHVLAKHKVAVKSSAHAVDDAAILAIVESGLGICVMPQLVLRTYRNAVQVFPFHPAQSRIIALASLDHASLAPAAQAMHGHIVELVSAWAKQQDALEPKV